MVHVYKKAYNSLLQISAIYLGQKRGCKPSNQLWLWTEYKEILTLWMEWATIHTRTANRSGGSQKWGSPKIDDKHALHVDEVHMKHTMPRLLTFSLNFNRKGNGTLERPPYAQVNPWDQQNLQGRSRHAFFSALWFWTGKLVDILAAWSLIRILRREPEIETKNKTSSQRSGPSSSHMHPPVAHDINFITCHVIAEDKQGIATTNNMYVYIYIWRRFCLTV